jgi:hypothetical protein
MRMEGFGPSRQAELCEVPPYFKRDSNPAGRTKIITGTYESIASAFFILHNMINDPIIKHRTDKDYEHLQFMFFYTLRLKLVRFKSLCGMHALLFDLLEPKLLNLIKMANL